MSGEDQERFEDYLELEKYVEELQAGRVAHPPEQLTPSQAHVYRMAMLFRSVSPEASEPRPEFATELQARLEHELQEKEKAHRPSLLSRRPFQKKPVNVSRRSLLAGGAAIAASLVMGAGVERAIEMGAASKSAGNGPVVDTSHTPIVPSSIPTTWLYVTALADLDENAIRFATDTMVGYVLRDPGSAQAWDTPVSGAHATPTASSDPGKVIAMSAACTHMGCIVKWQNADRQFHCPCHGGIFAANGDGVVAPGRIRYLLPLPRLDTKVEDGKVYVRVPLSQT